VIKKILFLALFFTLSAAHTADTFYSYKVKKGDSISRYLGNLGFSFEDLKSLDGFSSNAKQLNNLSIGQRVEIAVSPSKKLRYVKKIESPKKSVLVGSALSKLSVRNLKKLTFAISRSLSFDGINAGLSNSDIGEIVDALSWEIDFSSDLHKGDRFTIIKDNENIHAISYTGRKRINLFLFEDKNFRPGFFDSRGKSLEQSFLRAPLRYDRISSGFQLKRYHPILKTYLPHRAVDYAAKTGTKVYSVADGVIKKRQSMGPLGKAIIIQHGTNYETVYAHLSKYNKYAKKGHRVKRGDVIGYVGSTGRSTGPHLHYEIRYKGKRRNPLTLKLPEERKIDPKKLKDFKERVRVLLSL